MQRRPVRRVAQQRLPDPLAEDAALAARGAEQRPLPFAPVAAATLRVQSARSAVEAQAQSRLAAQVQSRQPRNAQLRRGLQLQRDLSLAGPGCAAEHSCAELLADDLRVIERPAQARGQPAEEQHAGHRRGRMMAHGHGVQAVELRAHLRAVERRRDALAPGRRAQPREIDDVEVIGELARAIERLAPDRLLDRVDQRRLREAEQRVDGLRVAVWRPQQRRQIGHHKRVGDRQQVVEVALAEPDDDRLVQQRDLSRLRVLLGGDRGARVEARAAGLVGEHDQARGGVASDAAQAVGDLAAPFVVDERDHVEHARRHVAAAFGVTLGQQPAQRRFDRIRRRALFAPDRVAARHQIARQ